MNLTDKKLRLVWFGETVFIYVLAFAVVYCALFFLPRVNPFGAFDRPSYMWRLNPYLTLPYLTAGVLGMIVAPFVWEKAVRRIDLKQMGFAMPKPFVRELLCGVGIFLAFIVYCHLALSKTIELPSLPGPIMVSLSVRWLVAAFGEEFFFRGILQRRLCDLCGKYCGLVLASAVFAFAGHFKAPFIDNLILRLPFGLILGYLYLRSRSLLIPVAMHFGFNMLFAA